MSLRLVLSPEARADIARVHRWWRLNRPSNPGLFRQEITAARQLRGGAPPL